MSLPARASHDRCFGFEADFVADLRCLPMAVRRKLDLAGVKLKLSHWQALGAAEREGLLAWPDQPLAIEALRAWLLERTAAMAAGPARPLPPAQLEALPSAADDQAVPVVLAAACRQLGTPLRLEQWQGLDGLQRFALVKLSHPGHEHRNLPRALLEFGLSCA